MGTKVEEKKKDKEEEDRSACELDITEAENDFQGG
jgi:hypothetical protein